MLSLEAKFCLVNRINFQVALTPNPKIHPNASKNSCNTFEKKTECANSVLINFYEGPNDYIAAHSDDEPNINQTPKFIRLVMEDQRILFSNKKNFQIHTRMSLKNNRFI